jgi:hypothetical protein
LWIVEWEVYIGSIRSQTWWYSTFEMKAKLCIVVLEDHGNNLVQVKDSNANWINEMAPIVGYHNIMWKQSYLANGKWDMSWWFWIGLYSGLLCMNKKSLIVD